MKVMQPETTRHKESFSLSPAPLKREKNALNIKSLTETNIYKQLLHKKIISIHKKDIF